MTADSGAHSAGCKRRGIDKGNKKLFLLCFADVARAHMINGFASKHGMDRDGLWNMLTDDIEPAPEVLTKLMETLGTIYLVPQEMNQSSDDSDNSNYAPIQTVLPNIYANDPFIFMFPSKCCYY